MTCCIRIIIFTSQISQPSICVDITASTTIISVTCMSAFLVHLTDHSSPLPLLASPSPPLYLFSHLPLTPCPSSPHLPLPPSPSSPHLPLPPSSSPLPPIFLSSPPIYLSTHLRPPLLLSISPLSLLLLQAVSSRPCAVINAIRQQRSQQQPQQQSQTQWGGL